LEAKGNWQDFVILKYAFGFDFQKKKRGWVQF
jgi:hypothetical protein